MIEMSIDSIRVSPMNYQHLVLLKEKQSDRYLPIWIGPAEAEAIAIKLQNVDTARPLTHDLLGSVISTLGATVNFIVVNDLRNDTFYAKITMTTDGKQIEIDSRPSDAMALAVRCGVPIYVADEVMSRGGIVRSPELEPVSPEEEQSLSAFRDFVNSLDLEDEPPRES